MNLNFTSVSFNPYTIWYIIRDTGRFKISKKINKCYQTYPFALATSVTLWSWIAPLWNEEDTTKTGMNFKYH